MACALLRVSGDLWHPCKGFCSLCPATHTLLATHSGTQQNVQEVQMSLLLDLFKFLFIFKGLLSLLDHLVWRRKGLKVQQSQEMPSCKTILPLDANLIQGGEHYSVHDAFDLCFCITGTLAFSATWQQMPWTLSSFLQASLFTMDFSPTLHTPRALKSNLAGNGKSFLALVLSACPSLVSSVYRSISRGQFLH